jgi:uncharacterized OsmC-like protein
MGEADIAGAIANARDYLKAHPTEARYRDSPATASIEDGLRVRVSGAGGASMVTDMVTGVGGGNAAPSPGWIFRAAYASCVATLIAMRAAEHGFPVDGLKVTLDSESDDRGILGIDEDTPPGPLSVRVQVRVSASGADASDLRAAIARAVARCPVHDAVIRAIPVEIDLRVS